MTVSDVAIRVEGLGKQYVLGENVRYKTLRESWRDAFRRSNAKPETIWALKDVSFEVKRGEVVGVIGRNGAGKSTLLKILSRITRPTTGLADIYGRVGSLLEVGTGFHPELTGRENIFLNGAILGMTRREVQAKFDEIVAFAEVEQFLDTPVKRYSSGMYVRLAFAVAAHLEPDILLVDEVLAVGDAAFQKKCLGKMEQVSRQGRTVFFVSHNMAAVNGLCSRAVLLTDGAFAGDGEPQSVTEQYLSLAADKGPMVRGVHVNRQSLEAQSREDLRVQDVCVENPCNPQVGPRTGDPLRIRIHYDAARHFVAPAFIVSLRDYLGIEIIRLSTRPISAFDLGGLHRHGEVTLDIERLPLVGGRYFLDVGFAREGVEWLFNLESIVELDVQGADVYRSGFVLDRTRGMIVVPHRWLHESRE